MFKFKGKRYELELEEGSLNYPSEWSDKLRVRRERRSQVEGRNGTREWKRHQKIFLLEVEAASH